VDVNVADFDLEELLDALLMIVLIFPFHM